MNILHPGKFHNDNNSQELLVNDHMPPYYIKFNEIDNDFYNKNNNTIDEFIKDKNIKTIFFNDYLNFKKINSNINHYYGDWFFNNEVNDYKKYKKYFTEIDFNSKDKKFCFIANKLREPRALASCWIRNNFCLGEFNYTQGFVENEKLKIYLNEFLKIECKNSYNLDIKILDTKFLVYDFGREQENINDSCVEYRYSNAEVFFQLLKEKFEKSCFSIVMEPVFFEHGCMITEKYINAILGGTIPIINGYKIYECLKIAGFDTFDDIIDTSAQYQTHAVKRILDLLESNKHLLDNPFDILADKRIQSRILKNIDVLLNYDSNFIRNMYPDEYQIVLSKLNLDR